MFHYLDYMIAAYKNFINYIFLDRRTKRKIAEIDNFDEMIIKRQRIRYNNNTY